MTDQEKKPGLDEQTFGKLVEAAYVLQEHNRDMREMEESLELQSEQLRQQESASQTLFPRKSQESQDPVPAGDYTLTLAEIVEAQHQIQRRHLALDPAMAVVAERVARITNARGAGIGLLEEKSVHYRAGAGAPALPVGSEVPLDAAVCAASVRTGQVIRSEDVSLEFLFDAEGCLQRGIQSLISVPIYHDGNIVGGLELYFDRLRGFAEQDVHTCQLMAGLVTEAIGREAESSLKKSVASERSTMLAAIEKLKPNLAALADQASDGVGNTAIATTAASGIDCWKCGGKVLPVEQYCGKCGASRTDDSEPSEMQRKLAEAWHRQQANQEASPPAPEAEDPTSWASTSPVAPLWETADSREEEGNREAAESFSRQQWEESNPALAEFLTINAEREKDEIASYPFTPPIPQPRADEIVAPEATLVKLPQSDGAWTSANKAREFLEGMAATPTANAFVRLWHTRRGSIYLAVAVILVLAVIRQELLSGGNPVGATGQGVAVSASTNRHKQPAPDADLSMFDKFLISLGLAEAPEAPQYKGNPDTRVWVDLHTALYYCPGSDLYGRTPKGRFASQHAAQLDQFEPALRKACD